MDRHDLSDDGDMVTHIAPEYVVDILASELGSPLALIVGWMGLWRDELAAGTDTPHTAPLSEWLKGITDAATRSRQVIQSIRRDYEVHCQRSTDSSSDDLLWADHIPPSGYDVEKRALALFQQIRPLCDTMREYSQVIIDHPDGEVVCLGDTSLIDLGKNMLKYVNAIEHTLDQADAYHVRLNQ
ncbi:MAG: hypothetical protein JW966_13150 [Anaerolineae bacterium]|nr:hypothetical protein [Anaerolineae bacterium]